jgi:hypothetical protein
VCFRDEALIDPDEQRNWCLHTNFEIIGRKDNGDKLEIKNGLRSLLIGSIKEFEAQKKTLERVPELIDREGIISL